MDSRDSQPLDQRDIHPSRRQFLARAGFLAGGMALLGLPSLRPSATQAALQTTTIASVTMLELDGAVIDVRSIEGGFPKADVINEPPSGVPPFIKKHVGSPKFQEVVIECLPVMPKPLSEWVTSTLNLNYLRKNGAIISTDFNRVEQSRLQFNNAMITEVGFPGCDASSKDPGFLTIKFAPEFTTPLAGKGGTILGSKTAQKIWSKSNFRLTIPGLDCSKVNKIEAFSIKQKLTQDTIGQVRDYAKQPGTLEVPNLAITLSEAFAGTFYAWFQEMVLQGKAGDESEKIGTLELLDPTLTTTLMTLTFHHLGIFGFAPQKLEPGLDTIKRVRVEMYCEQITLTPSKA